ncbi:MAG: antibiotic biosynthesis monooxygenase [Proteobacteria bacterium]|nr:antibiotic biosynthesis monooxygenase [Pseudomonadota bacterium]
MSDTLALSLKTCSIAMRFDAAHLPRALELLVSASGPTRVKRGCRACRIEQEAEGEGVVRYTEEWDSDEAFHRHLRSDEFWRVLLAMDLCSEEPEVAVGALSARYGLEALRELRETPSDVDQEPERVE